MKNLNLDICDFHAHILPKADHGSYSIETSLRQMELAVKYGIRRIVATPHFYPHAMNVQDYIKKRDASFSTLQPMLPENISIRLGAEVLLCDNLENLPNLEMLCIGHSNTLLVELPYSGFSNSHVYSLVNVMDKGFKVVLAHAERYDVAIIDEFISLGAVVQLNPGVLSGKIAKGSTIDRWLTHKSVCAIGSDIHGADKNAYAAFYKAVKKHCDVLSDVKRLSDELWSAFAEPNLTYSLSK